MTILDDIYNDACEARRLLLSGQSATKDCLTELEEARVQLSSAVAKISEGP